MGELIDTAIKVGSFGLVDTDISGKQAAREATREATGQAVSAQREALDYLREREELPQQFREGALAQLAGLYGLEGGTGTQASLIERAMESPIYGAIMGGQQAGEEAILRSAAATGGLRSGGVQENLAEFSSDLRNKALLEAYQQQVSGLSGLASLPSMAPQIAAGTAGIGQTLAQGTVAEAQSDALIRNQTINQLMQGGQLAAAFSDIRLKENINHIGVINGHNWYEWDWNENASDLGLHGKSEGVMAHEVYEYLPEAIGQSEGYVTVDYSQLGVQ